MPKRKKGKAVGVTESESALRAGGRETKSRRTGLVVISIVISLALAITGFIYYQTQLAPFTQPVLTVDGTVIEMGYFLKRLKLSGSDPATMLKQLADEQIIKSMAPAFGITVTPEEVDSALPYIGSTENFTGNMTGNLTGTYLTESEFNTWYQQQLNDSGLSDSEYRDFTRVSLLANKLQQFLSQRVPTTAGQIHLNVIVVANSEDAAQAKARIQAGESFADVAREVSLDAQSKDEGGDIGWLPRGILPFDSITFALDTGEVSDPVAVNPTFPDTSQYLLFMVSEKAVDRPIEADSLQVLRSRALSNWLLQEEPSHSITIEYDFNDPANQAWILWQLTKIGQ